jgi:hypothetical protein
MTAKRPEDWTSEEKLAAVLEAAAVSDKQLECLKCRFVQFLIDFRSLFS